MAAKQRLGRGLSDLIASSSPGASRNKGATPAKRPKTKRSSGHNARSKTKIAPQRRKQSVAKRPPTSGSRPAQATARNGSSAVGREDSPAASQPLPGFLELPVKDIQPSPYQPRRQFSEAQIEDLAESIQSEGLLQPVVVRRVASGYQLIAGERRWRACQRLGLPKMLARVVEVSDASSAVIALIENLQREGLNPVDESVGYASLMRDFDLTQEAVAERVGKARATVANALRLLQLDREIQGFLAKGMLSTGHAKVLLGLAEPEQRLLLARRIIEEGMSVREAERWARYKKAGSRAPSERRLSPIAMTAIRDLEKQIAARLRTRVVVQHTPKKGRLIIEYYGNEDLQRILQCTGLDDQSRGGPVRSESTLP